MPRTRACFVTRRRRRRRRARNSILARNKKAEAACLPVILLLCLEYRIHVTGDMRVAPCHESHAIQRYFIGHCFLVYFITSRITRCIWIRVTYVSAILLLHISRARMRYGDAAVNFHRSSHAEIRERVTRWSGSCRKRR